MSDTWQFSRRCELWGNRFAAIKAVLEKRPAGVAVVAGLVAALLASGYLSRREAEILKIAEPMPVVIAARDIATGEPIDEETLSVVSVPMRFVNPGAISSMSQARGRVAVVAIAKGSQVTRAVARAAWERMGVASLLPTGMRAFSVALPASSAAGGLVSPGDHADILATFDLGDRSSSQMTTLSLVAGARVLAVEKRVAGSPQEDAKKDSKGIFSGAIGQGQWSRDISVTLAVSPEDAQALAFAQQTGALALAVRPLDESPEEENVTPTTISSIAEGAGALSPIRKPFKEYRGTR